MVMMGLVEMSMLHEFDIDTFRQQQQENKLISSALAGQLPYLAALGERKLLLRTFFSLPIPFSIFLTDFKEKILLENVAGIALYSIFLKNNSIHSIIQYIPAIQASCPLIWIGAESAMSACVGSTWPTWSCCWTPGFRELRAWTHDSLVYWRFSTVFSELTQIESFPLASRSENTYRPFI